MGLEAYRAPSIELPGVSGGPSRAWPSEGGDL